MMLEIFTRLEFASVAFREPWSLLLLRLMMCTFKNQLPLLDHERLFLVKLDSSFRRTTRSSLSSRVETDRVAEWVIEVINIFSTLGATELVFGLLDGEQKQSFISLFF